MAKNNLNPADLYTMADAMQAVLSITGDDEINGSVLREIPCPVLGLSIPFKLEVVSSRVEWLNGKPLDKAVLFEGPGNFAVILVHEHAEKMLHFALLDGGKLPKALKFKDLFENFALTPAKTLHQVIDDILTPVHVAAYSRGDHAKTWEKGSTVISAEVVAGA